MSQVIKLEISDEVFTVLRKQAEAAGTSPARFIATLLEQRYRSLSDANEQKAREKFESHFGELNFSHAVSVDNEKIDEDLARAYANEAS